MHPTEENSRRPWQITLYNVIFEADTPVGKAFDVSLLVVILLSILIVMLESVRSIEQSYGPILRIAEWTVTVLFTIEYILRLSTVARPMRYARSFFGIVDVLSILPTYVSLFLPGVQSLLVIRALRLLRIFRVFKLGRFLLQANVLVAALRASTAKIIVFLGFVLTIATIVGSLMYLIEGEASGFSSIPVSVYWAIVTMTTVGYGDITPITVPGQLLAAVLMVTGYSILAVPTGIVSVEIAEASKRKQTQDRLTTKACHICTGEGHDYDAVFCKYCGEKLNKE